jgi:GNAT superfamily N-acetyltransferase
MIRVATPADVEAIADVHVRSWQATYRGQMPDEYLDGLSVADRAAMWRDVIARADPRRGVWIAEIEGEIVGFTAIGPCHDEDLSSSCGEVYTIYSLPSAWGKGVGHGLFERAVRELNARHFDPQILWVVDANAGARRFYEIAGWKPDGASRTEPMPTFDIRAVRYRAPDSAQPGPKEPLRTP